MRTEAAFPLFGGYDMRYMELESPRLIYRPFTENDFPIVFDWLSNPENMKYRSSNPKTEAEAWEYLRHAIKSAPKCHASIINMLWYARIPAN